MTAPDTTAPAREDIATDTAAARPSSSGSPSKHELNRARTRAAIAQAAQDLVLEKGFGAFTAHEVAEAAGCSRRTFFNYYPSVAAAVLEPLVGVIDELGEVLEGQPADKPVLDVVLEGVSLFDGRERMARIIARMSPLSHEHPELQSCELQGWARLEEQLERSLAPRLPGADPLVVKALKTAVASSAHAACEAAVAAFQESGGRGGPDRELAPIMAETARSMLQIFLRGLASELPADHAES